jgi:hypothetical protein
MSCTILSCLNYISAVLLFLALISCSPRTHVQSENSKPTAFVFLSTDCPISQKYVGDLNKILSEYRDSVQFRFILPGAVSYDEIQEFVKEFSVDFPLEPDKSYERVVQYKATITPEVILVDENGQEKYRGAIDNWFFDLGHARASVTEHYLRDALRSVLKHQTPAVTSTKAVGCIINYPVKK